MRYSINTEGYFIEIDGDVTRYGIKDFTKFDIAHTDYFYLTNHPDEEGAAVIDKIYEKLYTEVAGKCNESQEYTIDCFKDRYTCRRIDEIDKIRYDAMTEEEKEAWDVQKLQEKIDNKRAERDRLLETVVDPIVTNPLRYNELSTEEQELYANYRKYLLNIPQQEAFPDIDIMSLEEYKEYNW